MIKIKNRPKTPHTLRSKKVRDVKQRLLNKNQRGERIDATDLPSYWSESDIKDALWNMHNGKCCYCERKRDMKRESDVEHFRPKLNVANDNNHPGYWWLAYEWDNYLLSCKTCNQTHKKTNFPLLSCSTRAQTPEDDLKTEKPVLINPAEENPEDYIGFDWSIGLYVKAIGRDDALRGHNTALLLGLNAKTLLEQRVEILDELMNIAQNYFYAKLSNNRIVLKDTKKQIKLQTSGEKEFTGFRRHFFRNLGLYDTNINI
jgi:uncharacterized protein (TIGR02646 family)